MPTIIRGENALIRRNLLASNGTTPVLLSSLVYLSAQIKQFGIVMAEYIMTPEQDPIHAEIREGLIPSQVEVEITKTLSDRFKEGPVTMKLSMEQADAEFDEDQELRDIDEFEIFTVE
jgi:hypothetical protein